MLYKPGGESRPVFFRLLILFSVIRVRFGRAFNNIYRNLTGLDTMLRYVI
jgi:hypothetical protein